ncbi:PDZ domain-containing protein [Candidatus Woesearchaeota archaeon]|nr:MAG: PDZ domain-containing protein [Candidatus Woesearchaeota archaeon]
MSIDSAAFIALMVTLAAVVIINRKKLSFSRFTIFYAAMYRGTMGISLMDRIARKYKPLWQRLATLIIVIGFLGMAFVLFDLARGLIMILATDGAPSVGVVLPFKAKGVFYVPFFYWIASIFIILVVHEGMHGVMARVYNLPVKNSGLVVLGAIVPLIPGAFVEPDEKKLLAAPKKQQLAVYAAGPVANIVMGAALLLAFSFILTPIADTFYSHDGVVVTELMDGNPPAVQAGLDVGEKITAINGKAITGPDDFSEALQGKSPGDSISVLTSQAVYDITLGENPQNNRAWLGVFVENPLKAPTWATHAFLWVQDLIFWLAVLSLGVGLFNLIPLGPVDGGRMLLTALEHVTHKQRADRVWKSVSFVLLGILLTNVVLAFI